jgi:hypothetical protein
VLRFSLRALNDETSRNRGKGERQYAINLP